MTFREWLYVSGGLMSVAWLAGCAHRPQRARVEADARVLSVAVPAERVSADMERGSVAPAASPQSAELPPAGVTGADDPVRPPAATALDWEYLTGGRTFSRPIADQRWPVFSASLRAQENGRFLDAYEHVSLGDTVAIARGPVELGGRPAELEVGLQGAVFSVFDPKMEQNLIIVDYVVAGYAAVRRGRASGIVRLWHISGHIGDEFLLDERYGVDDRLPYKVETIQLLGSYDFPAGLRVYGGPSWNFDHNPDEYADFQLQSGVEWWPDFKWGRARPIAAADVKLLNGPFDFEPDVSIRAGLSFDGGRRGPAFQLLGEVYTGHDPNGEFFTDHVTFAGLGIYFQL